MIEFLAILSGVLLVLGPGYLLWLRFGASPVDVAPPEPVHWPDVDILVPFYNEAPWLPGKLANLLELDYPREHLNVILVDGGSTDGGGDLARRLAAPHPRWRVLQSTPPGKTAQLNAGLRFAWSRWVLVTDADAHLPPDALRRLVAQGESDPRVQVVGTRTQPVGPVSVERVHWNLLNRARRREAARGFALVTGPCYLFRRDLLRSYPSNVVADDVYATFQAARSGCRVGLVNTQVTELRTANSLCELARHKGRKADAYMREILRFLPEAGSMPHPVRSMFLWRAAQFLLFPVLALLWVVLSVAWVAADAPALLLAGAVLVAVALGASRLRAGLLLALLLSASLLAALFTAPLARQRSTFRKVGVTQPASEKV